MSRETATQRKRRLEKAQQKYQEKRLNETDESGCEIQAKRRKYMVERRQMETEEQRQNRLSTDRANTAKRRRIETEEQRQNRLSTVRANTSKRRQMETEEQRQNRLSTDRASTYKRRRMETKEQRENRLSTDRANTDKRRRMETDEQWQNRLSSVRTNMAERRQIETNEQHAARLAQIRLRAQALHAQTTTFENSINVFCDKICEVCTKCCYPNQVSVVQSNNVAWSYLPAELAEKSSLLLCSRCKRHITNLRKTQPPSKAYWNNLDPGDIPEEIHVLSEAEQRLLSRIIPFVKVVKLSGRFGQYGFRGQAILFAMDIFDVSERLPNMLPISPSRAGIIVVTEHLENLDIIRRFSISRDRVNNALEWLRAHNPLYRDVEINRDIELNEADIIRVNQLMLPEEPESFENPEPVCDYIPISTNARIIRASWHQADINIFNRYPGVQCCAITLANIIRASMISPKDWSRNTLDRNMIEGDALYTTIRLTIDNELDESGYLNVQHFNHIRENIVMFNASFEIEYDEDTNLFGSLQDSVNQDIGKTLYEALSELFLYHSAGILIASSKALGVMFYDGKYYFTDSHSCGPKGASANNGRACVIECDTLQELHRICKRTTSSKNIQFTINYVEVHLKETFDVPEPVQVIQSPSEIIENAEIQTSVMVPIDAVHPDVEDEFEVCENPNEIRRKTRNNIVNESHELKSEEFAWYYLFPYGKNGLKEERPVHITPLDYYQFRILGKDTRFQRNDYLFYALSMFEYYRVKSTISACGRNVEGQDGTKVEDVHLYMKNLRGSSAYWRTALNELLAHIRCLGPLTYFLTFSCNDLHWKDMRKALLIADGRQEVDANDIDIIEAQRLIEKFPVIVSRHFNLRVIALMNFLLNNNEVLGGKVIDHWSRVEFQNRGSPHLHMVVWIAGHHPIETPEGIRQVDNNCSCEMPSDDLELYQLVKKCQVHRHSDTCKKNDATSTVCRFNMPRPVSAETHTIDPSSDEFIQNGGRICILKRRNQDRWINNYNPILLKLWKGNMDIQPCGSNESIAYYIAKYISKSEPSDLNAGIREAIQQIRREETDISRKLFKICMRIMKERQVSACECVYRLCHLKMHNSSRKTVFLNTRKPEQRYRVIKFDETGQADGYCANIFEKYEKRPRVHEDYNFKDMSLMEFAMRFEPLYAKRHDNDEEDIDDDAFEQVRPRRNVIIKLSDNSKMIARTRPAVVRVPHFVAATDPENYYYSLLLQYLPYYSEDEILAGFDNAEAAFLAKEQQLKESSEHMELYRERDRQLENAFNQVHAFRILDEAEPLDIEEEEEVPYQPVNEDDFQRAQAAMNIGQRGVFSAITRSIRQQLNGGNERLRLYITGGAGTGKTFLLNLLKNQINRCYGKESVKVCALTGVAARLINGSTIHSILKLPVQKDGRSTNMLPLTGNYLRIMRQQWKDIEFIIIDEISMVSYQMLCMIDSRLRQLKNKDNEFFGGINVLLFGDLMQLPPIRRSGNPVFKQPLHLQPATHLWQLFTLCELNENMRQQGDNAFADLLNALRIGEMRAEHFAILTDKILKEPSGEFTIEKALRIYPTNKQVEDHNRAVIQHFKNQNVSMYTIKAQDQIVDATRDLKNVTLSDIIPIDINKTGGLPKELVIFVGAKVMLRSNIDQKNGLVNGAIGIITEIVWPYFRRTQMYENDIPSVWIDFGRSGIHLVQPKAIQFPAKFSYGTAERRMLPLVLSWASTVHKLQGSTVDYAVVYLGPKLFEEGQAYVALSRVRSLDGLRLEELDNSKLIGKKPCNKEALAEMVRMRNI